MLFFSLLFVILQSQNENFMKRVLFIDRDGTLIREPEDEQIDAFEKLELLPGVIRNLVFLSEHTDFELVMVSNQDGLGTAAFPENTFYPVQDFLLNLLKGEGVTFADVLIDRSFEKNSLPTRKPGIGLLKKFMDNEDYDLKNSFVIGDRLTDVELAVNLGCKAILLQSSKTPLAELLKGYTSRSCHDERAVSLQKAGTLQAEMEKSCVLQVPSWKKIAEYLFAGDRTAEIHRVTKETDIYVKLNVDGTGQCDISTGLGFFDHMLEQIGRHGMMDLTIHAKGDLQVDEHHTIEDTALTLGECLKKALGDKRGIERYGFCLPMDDCLCQVALDFGGRPWLVWDAEFHREKIGEMPTEMFLHFFKSLSDAAAMNLNVKAEGMNEHHKIEGIFKALARALKMAVRRDVSHFQLPSTKGML